MLYKNRRSNPHDYDGTGMRKMLQCVGTVAAESKRSDCDGREKTVKRS